jgi:hypothetical protein
VGNWFLERNPAGEDLVRHFARPRFAAYWRSGEAPSPAPGDLWTDPGSGSGADGLHLFGFVWRDPPPEEEARERLLRQAAGVIDAWIARRL